MDIPFKVNLEGKTAVVTGGGGVLCSVFARALAACGAKTAVLGRTLSTLEKTVRLIREGGGTAEAFLADVTDKESLMRARDGVLSLFGPCDILLNGAGGNSPAATTDREYYEPEGKSFFELTPEGVAQVFGLNFTGVLLATQVFARDMAEKRSGTIINVSSMNAFRPLTKIPAYSAAKSAVGNLTQWLAVYFSRCGIRVNALAPGFFVTEQNRALLYGEDGAPTPRTGKILAATPMGRFGAPEELAGALLFLADERASGFVTGITLPVDGGFSAYSGV
jgi:NAD(P)-dependent dehydrogenase (short-subunit alcohol dehydrogenase family)